MEERCTKEFKDRSQQIWSMYFLKHKGEEIEIVFSTTNVGTVGYMQKKMNLNLNLIPYVKMNSKLIINVNLKCKTKEKHIEEISVHWD